MKIHTVARPYVATFRSSGHSYRLSAEETQRLLDGYPAISATPHRVVLRGDGESTIIRPATVGGGPAFVLD